MMHLVRHLRGGSFDASMCRSTPQHLTTFFVTKFMTQASDSIGAKFAKLFVQSAVIFASKSAELDTAMKANQGSAVNVNKGWLGAQIKVDLDVEPLNLKYFVEDEVKIGKGSEPHAFIQKLNVWRWGGGSMNTFPGMGVVLTPLHQEQFYVAAFPVESIIREGISLKNVLKFFNETQGINVLNEVSKIVRLEFSSVLFVPTGWVALPVYLNPGADTKAKVKGIAPWAMFLSIPVFSVAAAKALPIAVWKSIESFNLDYLKRKATDNYGTERLEFFKSFAKDLD